MFLSRITTLALTPALAVAFTPADALAQCEWELVPTPNPSDVINFFSDSSNNQQALHALLVADDSFSVGNPLDYHVLRRDAGEWTNLGGPGTGQLDGIPSYFALHADELGRAWIGGVSGDDTALQDLPVIARFDGAWHDPQEIAMVDQPVYPFYDRGGSIYAIDTAADGTMFAVGIAKGYALTGDSSVPLFLVNNGSGWNEVTQASTDWPGGFSANTYLRDVIAFSSDNVWAVGRHSPEDGVHPVGGLIVHWDGTSLSIVEDPRADGAFLSHPLEAMAANGPDDIWAVGGNTFEPHTSTIAHYDGKSWTRLESPVTLPLRTLALDDSGNAWAASINPGSDIAYFDGAEWSAMPPPVADAFIGEMSIDPAGTVWTLGSNEENESLALQRDCTDSEADLDGDGVVGFGDLVLLLTAWGPCPPDPPCPGDINGSGTVGLDDLLTLLASWG